MNVVGGVGGWCRGGGSVKPSNSNSRQAAVFCEFWWHEKSLKAPWTSIITYAVYFGVFD